MIATTVDVSFLSIDIISRGSNEQEQRSEKSIERDFKNKPKLKNRWSMSCEKWCSARWLVSQVFIEYGTQTDESNIIRDEVVAVPGRGYRFFKVHRISTSLRKRLTLKLKIADFSEKIGLKTIKYWNTNVRKRTDGRRQLKIHAEQMYKSREDIVSIQNRSISNSALLCHNKNKHSNLQSRWNQSQLWPSPQPYSRQHRLSRPRRRRQVSWHQTQSRGHRSMQPPRILPTSLRRFLKRRARWEEKPLSWNTEGYVVSWFGIEVWVLSFFLIC